MDQEIETNLDSEFKRHLQILRPYLGQLLEQDVIDVCNAWIKKLSECKANEKALRNKYVFALCYQLARGVLGEPFQEYPPPNELPPLHDDRSSDSSFTEVEDLVIDLEDGNTKICLDQRNQSQIFTDDSGINVEKHKQISCTDSKCLLKNSNSTHTKICKTDIQNYYLPYNNHNFTECYECNDNYQLRANNLILKLREMKKQNILLQNEVATFRQASKIKRDIDDSFDESILKVDVASSAYNYNQDSNSTLKSLKYKLQEVKNSRNDLIETIGSLQEKLDHFNEMKKHEIEEIESKHKLEIIKLKSCLREEIKADFQSQLNKLRSQHEKLIMEMNVSTKEEIEKICKNKEQIVAEKDRLLQIKEAEISTLKSQLEDLKNLQVTVLNKFKDRTSENPHEYTKSRELEKRLNKMERTKHKCTKDYEAKVASLQREKHLAEYSLQLQLVKQRAQVLNEVTEENQIELATALDKLENKYKEIVANVQATAFQRRLQDQIALESLIQAVCNGIPKQNSHANQTNLNTCQIAEKSESKNKDLNGNKELDTLCQSNKVNSIIIENKSYCDDSVRTGYCLESEKLRELFEKIHIPQKDVADVSK